MKLEQWVDSQVKAAADASGHTTRRAVIEALAKRAGVAYGTLAPADRGGRLVMYDKALAVSEATEFKVSVIELCDPDPATRLTQIRDMVAP